MATTFHYYAYTDDQGSQWAIKLSDYNASVVTTTALASADVLPAWPYHEKGLRHVVGQFTLSGKRYNRKLIICQSSDTIYHTQVGPVTWVDQSTNTVTRTARFGEKKTAKIV